MSNVEQRLSRIETLLLIQTKEVLNVKEASLLLDLSEDRVRHLVSDREIPHYKTNTGRVSFKKSELEAWKLGDRIPTRSEISSQASTYIHTKR